MIESLTLKSNSKLCSCSNQTDIKIGCLMIPNTTKVSHITIECEGCKTAIAQTVETIKFKFEKVA